MKLKVVVICDSCRDYNKHHKDDKDFSIQEIVFNTFSEAHEHLTQNHRHWMSFEIREEENV